jgi:hypothetical protein
MPALPWGAYLFFLRWGRGEPEAVGHLETEFLVRGQSETAVREAVGRMSLLVVKATLDGLIRGRRPSHAPRGRPRMSRGTVLGGTGGVWRVLLDEGTTVDASMRGRLKRDEERNTTAKDGSKPVKLAVGDIVDVEVTADADGAFVHAICGHRATPFAAGAACARPRVRRAGRRREPRSGAGGVRCGEPRSASAHARSLSRDRRSQ